MIKLRGFLKADETEQAMPLEKFLGYRIIKELGYNWTEQFYLTMVEINAFQGRREVAKETLETTLRVIPLGATETSITQGFTWEVTKEKVVRVRTKSLSLTLSAYNRGLPRGEYEIRGTVEVLEKHISYLSLMPVLKIVGAIAGVDVREQLYNYIVSSYEIWDTLWANSRLEIEE